MPTAHTPLSPVPHPKHQDDVTDPTVLTTQQLWREIEHANSRTDLRFDAMDKAVALLQDFANRSPTIAVVDEKLAGLRELLMEKFTSIQTQFRERDARTDQTAKDSKTAIDAALQAAEKSVTKQNENFAEATEKSERSVTKEIDAVKVNMAQTAKAMDDKIAALDKRLTEINGHSRGLSDGWGYLVGAIGVLIAIATFAISLTDKTP